MKAAVLFGLVAVVSAACSSNTTEGTGDGGSSGSTSSSGGSTSSSGGSSTSSGGTTDAGTDGGFDFTFTGGGTDIKQSDFKVAPIYGSFCMGTSPKSCSFTGSVTIGTTGCSNILNISFVGALTVGASFPIVADSTTPPDKGTVSYTEACSTAGATKMWKATGGTIRIDAIKPGPPGLTTSGITFTVEGATMAAAPVGAGGATGTFTVAGKASNVSYGTTN